jgi:hypothetical protein
MDGQRTERMTNTRARMIGGASIPLPALRCMLGLVMRFGGSARRSYARSMHAHSCAALCATSNCLGIALNIVSYASSSTASVLVRDHVSSLEPAFLGATPHADADQSGHHLLLDFCIPKALRYMLAALVMF